MLAELETGLVQLFMTSALRPRVRQIDSLPNLEGDSLIGRLIADAPAIYVTLGSFPVKDRRAQPKYGISCVSINSLGYQAALYGDGIVIGLYEMLDVVMALVDGEDIAYGDGSVAFEVTGCDLVTSEELFQKGVYAGVVQIRSLIDIPLSGIDVSRLGDFKTFHTDFDIAPHQPAPEHAKWLREPPDHSSSAPELSDILKLKE